MKKEDRKAIVEIEATVQIGKAGLTASVVEEIKRQIEKRKVVKVRILKSALTSLDIEDMGTELAKRTDSKLVGVRGRCIVLKKPKK
jgi:RNA-binding protein